MSTALKFNNQEPPVLIIDKVGVIGEALARRFSKDSLVVLLSEKLLSKENSNVLHIPFRKNIPQAPDNQYSKIIIVDDGGNVTRESAFSFIDKALENNAPLFFIGSIRNVDVEHADEVVEAYENARVLVFGDLFDKQIVFDKESSISQFINCSRKKKRISVLGDGLALNFPITFGDTIKLIIKATELDVSQRIILLFSAHPVTDISLANIFKKINPDTQIDFIKNKKGQKLYMPKGAMHALDKYDLERKIKELDTQNLNQETNSTASNRKDKTLPSVFYILLIAIFILLLPMFSTLITLSLAESALKDAGSNFKSGELKLAMDYARRSQSFFVLTDKTFLVIDKGFSWARLSHLTSSTKNRISMGKDLSLASTSMLESIERANNIYTGQSSAPRDDFAKASVELKSGVSLINKVQADGVVEEAFQSLDPFSNILMNSPEALLGFLGFDVEKKYLLLSFNENKLMPSGGAVEEVGLLRLRNGKVSGFTKYQVSEIDDKSGVEPSFQLRRYLGQKNLNISNSLSDINSPLALKRATDLFSKSTGVGVDGVIAVSSKLYGQLNEDPFLLLLQKAGNGIVSKDLFIYHQDPNIQNIFFASNWSGGIVDQRQTVNGRINDFFGIWESNLGKENLDISRTVTKRVSVDSKGIVKSRVSLIFKNGGRQDYKNYIQLAFPLRSLIEEIELDGEEQEIVPAVTSPTIYESKNFKPPKELEVYQTQELDKEIAGFLVTVPNQGLKTIVIEYTLPNLITKSQNKIDYSLNLYKLPGVSSYDIDLALVLSKEFQIADGNDKFAISLDKDKSISATILRK